VRVTALMLSAATAALVLPAAVAAQTTPAQTPTDTQSTAPGDPVTTPEQAGQTASPTAQGSVTQSPEVGASQAAAPSQDTAGQGVGGQGAGGPPEVTAAGDIIVTATRRSERLSDVPLAVSAVSQESLNNSGANDIRQLNQLAPSLLVSSTGSEANASARVRGVGTVGDNPGLESSVAVFVDGVYRSRTGVGFNDLGEIDRVEVLRGPQGTLSGRNASAGVINIYTRAPSFELGGFAEATYGNYDNRRFVGAISGPIVSDVLAARVDGVYNKRDGFFRDVNTGYRINDRDRYFVRGQLLFQPTADLSLRLIGDYTRRKEDCCAATFATTDIAPANAGLLSTANPIVPILTGVANTSFAGYFPAAADPYSRRVAITPGRSYFADTEDWGGSGEINWNLGGASLTSITAYREYRLLQQADADYGLADILNFGPDTGRRFKTFTQEVRLNGEAFGGKLDWLVGGYYANEDLSTVNQLQFGADYGRFAACRVAAGLGAISPGTTGCISTATRAGLNSGLSALGAAGRVVVAGLDVLDGVRNVGDNNANFFQNSENFAFFTHNIVHLTSNLDLTLGLRYTNERKTLDADFSNNNTLCSTERATVSPLLALGNATLTQLAGGLINLACQGNSSSELNAVTLAGKRKEDKFTGTAVLSWKPVDDLLVYGSYSRGYKAGGFNLDRSALDPRGALGLPIRPIGQANAAAYAANLQFDEEEVDAFEVGFKYSTPKFSLNVAGFRQEFSNFQLNTFNGTVFIVQNINGCKDSLGGADRDLSIATGACDADRIKPGLVSQGVEIETSLVPARDLRVGVGLTYSDTKYANNLVGSDTGLPLDPALRLLAGRQNSNAPKLVATNSLTWTPAIGSRGLRGLVYVDSRTSGDYNTGSDLFPQKAQDGFTLVNARLGIRGRDEAWAVEFWAQNVFDVNYTQVTFNAPFQSTTTGVPATGALAATYPAATYPAGTQLFASYLAEPRTYGVTLRTRF